MGELLRPPPPRSWRDRLAARFAAVTFGRVASGAGAVLLVAVTAWWLLRPGRLPVEASLPRAATSSAARARTSAPVPVPVASASTAPPTSAVPMVLVVQAAGAVVHPGVYRLPDGARVAELIEAAGGATADADLDRVALAAKLADGQRIAVPRRGDPASPAEPASGASGTGAVAPGPVGPVDLNRATTADLDRLPGVGPATAAAIVAYRDAHGPFGSIDELTEVPGIGPAKLAALHGLVTV